MLQTDYYARDMEVHRTTAAQVITAINNFQEVVMIQARVFPEKHGIAAIMLVINYS